MKNRAIIILVVLCIFSPFAFSAKYDTIVKKINELAEQYPQFLQIIDIGKNDQGNTIYGWKLENLMYNEANKTKVNHLLVGVHHGNEGTTADLCILFVEKMIKRFQDSNSNNYKSLSDSIYYIIPVLNISGYNQNSRSEKSSTGRYLDPNRDYPDVCADNKHFQLASIRNLVSFIDKFKFVGAITAHGYIGTFTYPWGIYTSNSKTQDDEFYKYMGKESVKENGYRTGTHTDVIYPASGAFEDWAYATHGIWCMLMELRRSANLDKDCECMIKFFALVPDKRSKKHQHTGNCTRTRDDNGKSRP